MTVYARRGNIDYLLTRVSGADFAEMTRGGDDHPRNAFVGVPAFYTEEPVFDVWPHPMPGVEIRREDG